jgi:hypothetical protein
MQESTNLRFEEWTSISEQMKDQRKSLGSPAELSHILRDEEQSQETRTTDSLLALIGTLNYLTIDISDMMMSVEMRQTKTDQSQKTQNTDPLLGLIGTLECEATDIGERHDGYIGDTLLPEFKKVNDE